MFLYMSLLQIHPRDICTEDGITREDPINTNTVQGDLYSITVRLSFFVIFWMLRKITSFVQELLNMRLHFQAHTQASATF